MEGISEEVREGQNERSEKEEEPRAGSWEPGAGAWNIDKGSFLWRENAAQRPRKMDEPSSVLGTQ